MIEHLANLRRLRNIIICNIILSHAAQGPIKRPGIVRRVRRPQAPRDRRSVPRRPHPEGPSAHVSQAGLFCMGPPFGFHTPAHEKRQAPLARGRCDGLGRTATRSWRASLQREPGRDRILNCERSRSRAPKSCADRSQIGVTRPKRAQIRCKSRTHQPPSANFACHLHAVSGGGVKWRHTPEADVRSWSALPKSLANGPLPSHQASAIKRQKSASDRYQFWGASQNSRPFGIKINNRGQTT